VAQETPMSYSEGWIASGAVRPPAGAFLLIRENEAMCALQFTGLWRGNDAKEPTPFDSGQESFRARYAWYHGERISGNWILHPPKASGESEVSQGRLVGLGRFAFGTGDIRIQCGPIATKWTAPAWAYFYYRRPQEQSIEIAVTRWRKFEDVNPNDAALRWLRYDKDRTDAVVPVPPQQ